MTSERRYKVDWEAVKADYVLGMSCEDLHNKYPAVTRETISTIASRDKWMKEREQFRKEKYERTMAKVEEIFDVGLDEMQRIITSKTSKDADKLNAFKLMTTMLGLDKKKIEVIGGLDNTNEHNINVIINRNPVPSMPTTKEIIIDSIINDDE